MTDEDVDKRHDQAGVEHVLEITRRADEYTDHGHKNWRHTSAGELIHTLRGSKILTRKTVLEVRGQARLRDRVADTAERGTNPDLYDRRCRLEQGKQKTST